MTAAARALGIAQSTVSETMASLARAIGGPAVRRQRGAHEVELTAAGRALLSRARRILAALADAERAAAVAASGEKAVEPAVAVIANESVSTYLLPGALESLRRQWPAARFSVSVGTCDDVRAGIRDARFDLGILFELGDGRGGAIKELDRRPDSRLADAKLVLFCTRGHPLAGRPGTVEREHLAEYPLFTSDATGPLHAMLLRHFRCEESGAPRLEPAGSVEAVKRHVIANPLAVGLLPAFAVALELGTGALVALSAEPPLPRAPLRAILPPGKTSSAPVAALVAAIQLVIRGGAGRAEAAPAATRR
jgi:DNA-binding transcriptional LysR family regulator